MKAEKKVERICDGITSLFCSGESLLVGAVDDSLHLLDSNYQKIKKAKVPLGCVSLKANNDVVVVSGFDNNLRVFSKDFLEEKKVIEGKPCESWKVEFSQSKPVFYTGGQNGALKAYSFESGEEKYSAKAFSEGHFIMALKAGIEDNLYVGSSLGSLSMLSEDLKEQKAVNLGLTCGIRTLSVGFDPSKLIIGCDDFRIYIADLEKEKLLSQRAFEGHNDLITDVYAFYDRPQFVSASLDKTVKHWDAREGFVGNLYVKDDKCIWAVTYLEKEKDLVLGADSGELIVLNI